MIHITGTKGKGSTSAFTDSILRQVKPEWKVGENPVCLTHCVFELTVALIRIVYLTSSRRCPRTYQNKFCAFVRRTVFFILLRGVGQVGEEPGGMDPCNLSILAGSSSPSEQWNSPHLNRHTSAW